ncbi:MAG TPA: hypothetical protein VMT52_18295, partial [Planctomycetota bacterium]|nr:hypothetical protein [Planctomycetota bacterium]
MADREDDRGTGGEGSSAARPAAGKGGKGLWAPTRGYFQLTGGKSAAGAAKPAARPAPKKETAAPGVKPAEAAVPAEGAGPAPAAAPPAERKEPVPRSATAKPAPAKAEGAKVAAAVKVDPRRDSISTVPTLSESTIENVIGQNLYDAPDSETTLYRVPSLNFLFSVSSALLLFFTILVAWKDYDRFWKRIQAGWNAELAHRFEKDLEAERAREGVMLAEMEPRLRQVLERVRGPDAARVLQEADALGPPGSPERASALVAGAREGLEKEERFAEYRRLRDEAKDAATRFALRETALRAFRGDFQAAKFRHDYEKRHIIDVHGDTPRAADLIVEADRKFTDSFVLQLEMLGAQVEELKTEAQEAAALLAKYVDENTFIEVEVDVAGETVTKRSNLSTIEGELGEIERGVREARNKVAAVEASWQNAVRNMPLLDFLAPTYKIEKAVLADLHEDLNFGTVPRVDRCKTCHINIDNVDPTVAGFRSEKLGLGTVYASHPRLDLFVGTASPHPYEKFGCTTCHYGDGYSTDFITAAHTPKDRAQREYWEKRFDWEPLHHQDYPMLEKKYVTSSCKKCHPDEHSLEGGGTYNLGYEVIKTYGCFGCHKIDAFKDAAKVGPSLLHIADKADISFIYRWIRDPTHFRPTTRMPKFFDLTNSTGVMFVPSKDGSSTAMDFRDRNGVEALALATYLTSTSQRRADLQPLAARGDAVRGRETFMTVGCLGCHSVKAESTEGEGEAAAEPHAAVAAALSVLGGLEAPGAKPGVAEAARSAEAALSRLLEWFDRLAIGENIEASYHRVNTALDVLLALDESLGADGGPVAVSKAAARTIHNRWVHNTFAPDLSGIGSKVKSPEWLASWISDPRKHDPKTVMPRFRFEDDADGEQKVADIVAYLLTLRDPGFEAREVFSIATPAASQALDDITYDYKSRQMTRGEARAAVESMLEDEKLRFVGHRLVRRYGCFGCHLGIADVDSRRTEVRDGVEVTVQGTFDAAEPIGTDLNGWGVKQAAFLDYGNWGHQHSGREAIGHTRYD